MIIHLGTDHGGYSLKEELKNFLSNNFFEIKDHGALSLDPEDDYPFFAHAVAEAVSHNPEDVGVLLCRSGGGVAITANKVKGVRAVVVTNETDAIHAKAHNDAQVICIPGDTVTDKTEAFKIVMAFLNAEFEGGRHARRLEQINEFENTAFK